MPHQTAANVEEIFLAALEIEGLEARSSYLDKVCGDAELRRHLERLLALDARASGFLASPASPPATTIESSTVSEGPGTVIGPYKLMEQIGAGGMGVVYVADQHQPVRRKVALKVIKPGMDTRQVIGRFEAERQALALMDHPNIAKIFDGGVTDSGRPYFVMELVRGLPITEYCDGERLSVRERLELFMLVCRAVQHAHQKGIIHRDLKPSNILVTLHDGVPVPKVIDFGVAKATGRSLTEKTVYTAFTQLVGTPLYMSPEQVELSGLDIDTRSDIYSLGVLLYELLTGTTPFDSESLRLAAFDEMRRMIREDEPQKPSTRLSSLGETLSSTSMKRSSDPRHLNRAVRGELDWIVMKALDKDRKRRFETANDFASDVMRYLTDQPVEACPPSGWYRLKKYARRNRIALVTTGLVALALLTGTAVSLAQAVEARKARRATAAALVQAQSRAEETQQVLDYFIKEITAAANGANPEGRTLTVTEVLTRAGDEVGQRFAGRPLLEARFRMALAETLEPMGGVDPAEFSPSTTVRRRTTFYLLGRQNLNEHVTRAWEIRRQLLGPEHPDTLASRAFQASLLSQHGLNEQAAPLAREVLAGRLRVLGPAHPDTIVSMVLWSELLGELRRLDESLGLAERAFATADTSLGEGHRVTLMAQHNLASILQSRGRLGEATTLLRLVASDSERALGPLDPETLSAWNDLGGALADSGRLDEARRVFEENVERHRLAYGFCHIRSVTAIKGLKLVLRGQRDLAGLRALEQRWIRELLAAPADPDKFVRHRHAVTLSGLAVSLTELAPTVPIDSALAIRAAERATVLSDTWSGAWTYLGLVHYRLGHLDEAEHAVRAALRRKPDPQEHALDPLLLALIHAHRGERTQGMAEFECYQKLPQVPSWNPFPEILEAEARALLGLADLPADVFAWP